MSGWVTQFRLTLRSIFRREQLDQELDEEFQYHMESLIEESVQAGLPLEEARYAARRAMGAIVKSQEECRDSRRLNFIDDLIRDLRYAGRSLGRSPGFTAVAIGMLALGIGINAAVFTVANAALFEGYPLVHRNDRIVQIRSTKGAVYYPDFEEWRAQAKSFEDVALLRGIFHTLSDGGTPETYFTTQVTTNTFEMLGVKPFLGRDFSPSDAQPGAEPVVILRYEVWVRRFGANRSTVGQIVRIDGLPTRVIGVMPQGFSFPATQDLWEPLVPTPAALRRETLYAPSAYARMADGVTIENARAEMETIGRRLAQAYPRTNRDVAPVVMSFEEWFIGENARTLYKGMWGAAVFVLLIVCANVANLSLGRAIGRSREISTRLALGAGRWRIVRQFLIESLILSVLGGVIGWWIAKAGVRIYALTQVGFSYILSFTMDHRVLVYLIAISIGAGLLAGLATATYMTKLNIGSPSSDGRGITGGKHGKHLSDLFVGAEMVLAIALLASAGVISRSFLKVYTANVGVNVKNVLSMGMNAPPEKYPSPETRISFYRDIAARLQALPGVESVGLASTPPTENASPIPYELADVPIVEQQSRPTVAVIGVSAGYFRTLGAKMISGREFDDSDRPLSVPVAIVNQQFASRNWPGEVSLGKRLRVFRGISGKEPSQWLTVVGVVSNIIQNDRTRQAFDPLVYLSGGQRPAGGFAFLRTSVPPESLISAVRRQIYAIDPDLSLPVLMPLAERFDRAYALERNVTVLFLSFATVALLLASIGLYAAISYSVTRRVQEIGIRVTVGATGRDILKLVFKQGILAVGMGLTVGLAVSFAANRVLKSQLVGVSPADPVALVAASAVLVLSATLGSLIPARRAMRVDPAVALRHS